MTKEQIEKIIYENESLKKFIHQINNKQGALIVENYALREEINALKAEIEEMEQRHEEELEKLREDYEEQIRDYCIPIPQERLVGISDRDFL